MSSKKRYFTNQINNQKYINTLEEDDKCLYFLEYATNQDDIEHTEEVRIVRNFKMDIKYKNTNRWQFKSQAISFFARIISESAIFIICRGATIIPAPTSKPRNHPLWDNRLDQVANILANKGRKVEYCLDTIEATTPAHHKGGSRYWKDFYENTSYIEPLNPLKGEVWLLDDVFTSGSHFKAYKKLLQEHNPNIMIKGLFLARAYNFTQPFKQCVMILD